VYILDKVQNNPTKVNGHPAWAEGTRSPFYDFKMHRWTVNVQNIGQQIIDKGRWMF
jgi:hypothetical protein